MFFNSVDKNQTKNFEGFSTSPKVSPGDQPQAKMPEDSGYKIDFPPFLSTAVGGENKVNKALYPNASQEQLKVRGYYVQFPGQESLKPCTTKYTRLASSYELFMTKFRFAVPIDYKKDVEVHQIPMHRYVLGKSAVEVNNVTVFTQGVFDVTRIFGGPMYISLPGFLYGEPSLYEELNLPKPDVKKHESFVSIRVKDKLFDSTFNNFRKTQNSNWKVLFEARGTELHMICKNRTVWCQICRVNINITL